MSELTTTKFLECLEKSGLLTDEQILSLKRQITASPKTFLAEEVGAILVSQQHLTPWQVNQLLKGQTGFVLEHYRLLNPVGKGGMGHVFRGQDTKSGEIVAIKVMARKLLSNQTLVNRFRREIRASSRLNSPHIVRSLDGGRVGKTDFLVMEFVNGDQLDRISHRLGRLPVGLACEIIRQAAVGLQHAHERQMVHRDIKPGNVIVDWDKSGKGTVKLMDMGLVRLLSDSEDEQTVTKAGQVMGTPDYMSPEQGWDTSKVDIRSDIYSLGCALFRLLTGQTPFQGTNPLQVLSQRLQRDAPSVLTVCDDIPPAVATVVSKMTTRDPGPRYQTPSEVERSLRPFCTPLTLHSLAKVARSESLSPEHDVVEMEDSHDESDGTYQQFLKEMENGASVDLVTFDPITSPSIATTESLLDLTVDTSPTTLKAARPRARRGQRTGFVVMGVATAILAAAGIFVSQQSAKSPVVSGNPQRRALAAVLPTASMATPEPLTVNAGRTLHFQPEATMSDPGQLTFELSSTAPKDATIDPATGAFTWRVPQTQTPAAYSIGIHLVHTQNDQRYLIAKVALPITVVHDSLDVRFPSLRPARVMTGDELKLSVAVDADPTISHMLQYQLTGSYPVGLILDPDSGDVSWTPDTSDAGRHEVTIQLVRKSDGTVIDSAAVDVFVMPREIRFSFPDLPEQQATPGELFEVRLFQGLLLRLQRAVVISPGNDAPDGVTIDPQSGVLRWNVPESASGSVRIPLVAQTSFAQMRFTSDSITNTVLILNFPESPPTNTMPPEDAVLSALEELNATYRSAIAQARSPELRAALASRLLEQEYALPNGPANAALLRLVREIAVRGRAYGTAFSAARRMSERYGVDEMESCAEIISGFRRTGLSQIERDLTIEHSLRQASLALQQERFAEAVTLIDMSGDLLRGNSQNVSKQYLDEIVLAARHATEIVRDSETATRGLKVQELSRILERWKFQRVFAQPAGHRFLQAVRQGNSLVGNGRTAWTFDDLTLAMQTETREALIGFVEDSQRTDRFVLRFELLPETTSAYVLVQASDPSAPEFDATVLVLDRQGFGKLRSFRTNTPIAEPLVSSTDVRNADRSDHVEVIRDGRRLVARVNGVRLVEAQLSSADIGRLGLAVSLGSANPQLKIRRPRLLSIPVE